MNVILPQQTSCQIGIEEKTSNGKYPTLYLLHGMTDDESCWIRRTSIECYVSELGIAVVMPNGDLNWYTATTTYGAKYWTYWDIQIQPVLKWLL